MVEVAKTKEGLDLLDSLWGGPICDSSHLGWVHGNVTILDNNAKVFNVLRSSLPSPGCRAMVRACDTELGRG